MLQRLRLTQCSAYSKKKKPDRLQTQQPAIPTCCATPTPQGSPECPPSHHPPYTDLSQPRKGCMAHVTWDQKPPTSWLAVVEGEAVCTLTRKDIGGWNATWEGERLWPPPAHLPKATPQPMRFFSSLDEAKAAVERELAA